MRFFVTGATGFVGGHLVNRLLARGDEIIALVRDPGPVGSLAAQGVRLVEGDLTDRASMRSGMEGVDGVFHVAGWYKVGVRDPETAYAVNVEGTRNVLELMNELEIPKGVYTSTLTVNSDTGGEVVDESYRFEGRHLSLYDRTKWIAHHQIAEPMMEAGLPLVIVQPGVVYGPGDTSLTGRALRDYLRRDLPMLPQGAGVCWSHVQDVARGHILAMERGEPGESYIIAGPPHTLVEAFGIAETITGIPAPRLQAPPWLLKAFSLPMGTLDRILPLPPEYTGEGLAGDRGHDVLRQQREGAPGARLRPSPSGTGPAGEPARLSSATGLTLRREVSGERSEFVRE